MSDLAMSDLEADIRQLGLRLHARARRPGLLRGLSGRLLARVARDDGWRDSLFPLIEALPQLRDAGAIAAHLRAGLPAARRADWLDALLRLAARPGLAWSVRVFTRRLALHFLCEENEKALRGVLAGLARVPARATLDAVGEQVLSEAEADQYLDRNLRLLEWMGTMARPHGPPHLSLKLSALTPRFDPLDPGGTRHRVLGRMAPLIDAASRLGATLTVDMEHYALKEAILDLFLHLAEACPGAWQPAIALQAYLRDTGDDLVRVHATARRLGRRLGVRLVKGAYWDQEQAWAAQRGWPVPAWTDKAATDAAFEAHTVWLLERSDCLHPAIASHNLRSQALALTHARRLGIADTDWEMQMLFGMAEPLRDALAGEGAPLRIYVPTGALDTGIAYLIRRLMENTASTSVLRQSYLDGVDAESLLQTPHPPPVRESAALPAPAKTFANLPLLDFSQAGERDRFAGALRSVRARLPLRHAGFSGRHLARNPAAPEEVLGEVGLALPEDADSAVARARARWRGSETTVRV
ncbi:MAG TPA: proline dehydrogenase family protein, partial [Rhodocyclaceae bacterium]|nr:proline dehydrogenase family protein [Rhodocyclaceae bacterium]